MPTRGSFNREGRIARPSPPTDHLQELADHLRDRMRHHNTLASMTGISDLKIRAEAKAEAYSEMLTEVEDRRFS